MLELFSVAMTDGAMNNADAAFMNQLGTHLEFSASDMDGMIQWVTRATASNFAHLRAELSVRLSRQNFHFDGSIEASGPPIQRFESYSNRTRLYSS